MKVSLPLAVLAVLSLTWAIKRTWTVDIRVFNSYVVEQGGKMMIKIKMQPVPVNGTTPEMVSNSI